MCVFQIEFFIMSDDETSSPPSGSGVRPPPVTTAAVGPPGLVTTTAVGPPGPGPAVTTTTVATVPDTAVVSLPGVPHQARLVYGSNSGQLSGGVSTTAMVQSSVTTPSASPVDPNMLANLIQSGLIPPLQMAELQQKLSALNMGGLSVPLPPINATPIPLFKTPDDLG